MALGRMIMINDGVIGNGRDPGLAQTVNRQAKNIFPAQIFVRAGYRLAQHLLPELVT